MIAVYPGSFDPITAGHFDIIERAAARFEKVFVVVAKNASKSCSFSAEDRRHMIECAVSEKGLKNVGVQIFSDGLLVDFVEDVGGHVIIKGLRAVSDFEYEFQMALINRHLRPDIETLFMMTRAEYSFLSSSIVREIVRLGGEIRGLVPDSVVETIQRGLGNEGSS